MTEQDDQFYENSPNKGHGAASPVFKTYEIQALTSEIGGRSNSAASPRDFEPSEHDSPVKEITA